MHDEMDTVSRSPVVNAVGLQGINIPAFPWLHVALPTPNDKLDLWVRQDGDMDIDRLLVAVEGLVRMLPDGRPGLQQEETYPLEWPLKDIDHLLECLGLEKRRCRHDFPLLLHYVLDNPSHSKERQGEPGIVVEPARGMLYPGIALQFPVFHGEVVWIKLQKPTCNGLHLVLQIAKA